ncbi:MAG: ABC transporter permease [Pseudomonadota bacterium]
MKNVLFLALSDVRHQLRQGSTLVWLFLMPPVFFYFIGTVTGGMSNTLSPVTATPLVVEAAMPGYLRAQLDRNLRANNFAPEWVDVIPSPTEESPAPRRSLRIDDQLTSRIESGESVRALYETRASALLREFESIRIARSVYTAVADIVVTQANGDLSPAALQALNEQPRVWRLEVQAAGNRQIIPSGFEQAVPGILVMFTLLILLTTGGTMLVNDRQRGLLRRLASAPITRSEVVAGKWSGRMVLAIVQVVVALIFGTLLFNMDWGPNLAMVLAILLGWAAFCASAGLLLGTLAKTEGQAAGVGVLLTNLLAALGGCWWPIEITPDWMQSLQNFLPTGWTMDALHKLISFQSPASAAFPQLVLLVIGTLVVGAVAARHFRYQ